MNWSESDKDAILSESFYSFINHALVFDTWLAFLVLNPKPQEQMPYM